MASRLAEIQLFLTEKRHSVADEDLGDLPVARNLAEEKKRDLVSEKVGGVPGQRLDESQERAKDVTWKARKSKKGKGGE